MYFKELFFITINLTQSPCKIQSLSRNWFSNFLLFFRLVAWSLCLKYIYIWLTPFGPLYGGLDDPKVPKMTNPDTLYWNHFRWKCLGILCQLISKSQNFTAILCNWENWENFANFHFTNFKTWFSNSWQKFKLNFGAKRYGCLVT